MDTGYIYSVVITRHSNPPIPQFSRLCNDISLMSVWSIFPCNTLPSEMQDKQIFWYFLWSVWASFVKSDICVYLMLLSFSCNIVTVIFSFLICNICFYLLQALGNLYFIHECVEEVMIYDFIGRLNFFGFCSLFREYHRITYHELSCSIGKLQNVDKTGH